MTDRKNFEAQFIGRLEQYAVAVAACHQEGIHAFKDELVLLFNAAYDAGREGQPVAEVSCRPKDEPRFEALRAVEGLPFGTHKLYTHPAPKADELEQKYPDDLGVWRDAKALSARCQELAKRLVPKADAAADWVCVPREPTEAMRAAANEVDHNADPSQILSSDHFMAIYRAMLAASPARGGEGEDAARLDWLDTNARFKMGWHVGVAPAGNISIQGRIDLSGDPPQTIRAAIDAAMSREAQG